MRRYDGKDRRVLSAIMAPGNGGQNFLGQKIGECLREASLGILVLPREEGAYVFSSSTRSDRDNIAMADVAGYMSLLTSGRESGLFYCVEPVRDIEGAFFCGSEDCSVARRSESGGCYDWDGGVIETEGQDVCVKNFSGEVLMKGFRCPDKFASDICGLFLSQVYPTQELYRLKDDDFVDVEMHSMEMQLNEARRSVLISRISLLLALAMPVAAVFIGNRWGYSKLDATQYDGLIQRIDSVCHVAGRHLTVESDAVADSVREFPK